MSSPKPCPTCGHQPADSTAIRSFSALVEDTMNGLSEQMQELVDGVVESTGYSR